MQIIIFGLPGVHYGNTRKGQVFSFYVWKWLKATGEMLCKPFRFSLAFLGKASRLKGNLMLTDYELLVMAVEENPDFLETVKENNKMLLGLENQEESDQEENLEENLEENQEESDQEENFVDYSDLLNEMNNNLIGASSSLVYLNEKMDTSIQAQGGLLNNTYYFVYFLFGFFVFGALVLVIKFLKQFF